MTTSTFPAQAFSWQVALLAESLIQAEGIDVIEAQEWEAPLYYLQLRRRLGLGPARHPPCVVHLHSSTEQIFAANAWDTSVLDYAPAASAEAFSIGACDALLSPSRFIAEEAMLRHGIQSSDITVLPYPIGDALPLERSSRVWSGRSICHVGRLEPRKGVIELADAVAAIAVEYPDLRIDFVGGDTPMEVTGGLGVGEAIRNRVPAHVRNQFRFHGSCDAVGVANILAGACAAIVPSRWENFPYSCIESMASGLPVIVSPNGGMRELVSDGVSGWIASEASPPGLAGALRRALASSGPERERMGRAARSAVTRTCDNAEVVRRHLQLKDRLIRKHKGRGTLPLSRASAPAADIVKGRCTGHSDGPANLGVVVSVRGTGGAEPLVASLRAQDLSPNAVSIVCLAASHVLATHVSEPGWEIVRAEGGADGRAEMVAARKMLAHHPSLTAIAFLDARVHLDDAFLSTSLGALEQDSSLGMVGAWMLADPDADRILVPPLPARPDLGWGGHFEPCVLVRAEALATAIRAAGDTGSGLSRREVLDQVASSGWGGLTYPAALLSIVPGSLAQANFTDPARLSLMARAIRNMHTPLAQRIRECSPAEWRALSQRVLREPTVSLLWLGRWLWFRISRACSTSARHCEAVGCDQGGNMRKGPDQ
ncbi:hypothetical protein GCM10010080_20770 [Thermomonas carbonis]|nr:hypothetical protein GCM10010080_20770 [Thermomonas carbonis]